MIAPPSGLAHLLLVALLLQACDDGLKRKPTAVGGDGEVLVVMSKAHWEGPPGALVRSVLEQAMPHMTRPEPRFTVAQVAPGQFASLLQGHHSVIVGVISGDADSVALRIQRDVHASGQLLMQASAYDAATWMSLFQRQAGMVTEAFEQHQRTRIAARVRGTQDEALVSSVRAAMGLELPVPGGYRVVEQTPRFAWLQRDRMVRGGGLEHNVIEGLLIHRHRYSSDSTFSVPYLVELRDSVTKAFVEGPDPGSYMIVQRSFEQLDLMPGGRETVLDGRFAYVMRGLFGMHGAKMGGPFVSLSTLNGEGTELITVEGFVYAPQFNKREYLRELEAILYCLRLTPPADA
jgi:hypothetical protein